MHGRLQSCGGNVHRGSDSGSVVAQDVHDDSRLFLRDFDRGPKSVVYCKASLLTNLPSGEVNRSGKKHRPKNKAVKRGQPRKLLLDAKTRESEKNSEYFDKAAKTV
jgi:hypothetical protein